MSNMNSIKKLSNGVLIILWAGLILNPISFAVLWFSSVQGSGNSSITFDLPFYAELPMSPGQAITGYLIANITIIVAMLMTWQLIKLFRLYRAGQVFTDLNIFCYQKIANLMIVYVVVGYAEDVLFSAALSYGNEDITFGITASDSDITLLISGIIIRVIAKVMIEAKALQDEQALTI